MDFIGIDPLVDGMSYIELSRAGGAIDLDEYVVQWIVIVPPGNVSAEMSGRQSQITAELHFSGGRILGVEPDDGPWDEPGGVLSIDVARRRDEYIFSLHLESLTVHMTAACVRLAIA